MLEFQMFRLKVHPTGQGRLFPEDLTRAEIISGVLRSLTSPQPQDGSRWHVGNLTPLDQTGLYFRIGRISRATVGMYEEGVFQDQEFETAPYTHALLDTQLGICCIAKKAILARSGQAIANQFARLLNKSSRAHELEAEFEIDSIYDPEDLISYLSRAYSISKFMVSFKRPNPFDAEQDFQRPMQNYLREAQGETGKTEIEGDSLKVDPLESLTRAAAASGDNAVAHMKMEAGESRIRKRLKENPVILSCEEVAEERQKQALMEEIRETYHRIRGNE